MLRFVFLEGSAGTGKTSIIQKLHRMGFTVREEAFVPLCLRPENALYSPGGHVLTAKWISGVLDGIGHAVQSPEQHKGSVVFFDRSPLTPWVYAMRSGQSSGGVPAPNMSASDAGDFAHLLHIWHEIKQSHDCRLVLCTTDWETVRQRLLGRLEMTDKKSPEANLRRALGEGDVEFAERIYKRYHAMDAAGWFDAAIDTTNIRVATSNLLSGVAGIEFELPSMPDGVVLEDAPRWGGKKAVFGPKSVAHEAVQANPLPLPEAARSW